MCSNVRITTQDLFFNSSAFLVSYFLNGLAHLDSTGDFKLRGGSAVASHRLTTSMCVSFICTFAQQERTAEQTPRIIDVASSGGVSNSFDNPVANTPAHDGSQSVQTEGSGSYSESNGISSGQGMLLLPSSELSLVLRFLGLLLLLSFFIDLKISLRMYHQPFLAVSLRTSPLYSGNKLVSIPHLCLWGYLTISDSTLYPLIDVLFKPTDRSTSKRNWFREFTFSNAVVDRRTG